MYLLNFNYTLNHYAVQIDKMFINCIITGRQLAAFWDIHPSSFINNILVNIFNKIKWTSINVPFP